MSFPTLGVLDAFPYSNGNLATVGSANWTTPLLNGTLDIVVASNTIQRAAGGPSSAYWTASVGAETEVYVSMPTVPGALSNYFELYARAGNVGLTTFYGYALRVLGDGEIYAGKYTNNTWAQIAYFPHATVAANDRVGFSVTTVGGNARIIVSYYPSGGPWAVLADFNSNLYDDDSSSPYLSAGNIGIFFEDTGWGLDDFGGGTIGGGGPYTGTGALASQVVSLSGAGNILAFPAYGYSSPDAGEIAQSWAGWNLGAGAVINGDPNYGDLIIPPTVTCSSPVVDMGDANSKQITLSSKYGTNLGSYTRYIRGSDTSFAWNAGSPSWTLYTTPVTQAWRYVQVLLTGG